MKILVLGKDGMLGQTVYRYLKEKGYEVEGTTRENFDVLNYIFNTCYLPKADITINCIGKLNHNTDPYIATLVNSVFPMIIDREEETKLIHISTDCCHDDTIYGHTKWLGEQLENSVVLRTSIIGHDKYKKGTGLLNWFLGQEECDGYTNHIWYGVTTLELAKVIERVLNSPNPYLTGIYEVSNGIGISKCKLLKLINEIYEANIKINEKNTGEIVNKVLRNDLELDIPNYETMIKEMKDYEKD